MWTKSSALDSSGRLSSLACPNGVRTAYAYDAASRLCSLTAVSPATPLFACAYTYSPSGRTSSMTDSRLGTTAYAYTSRGELAGYADPLARRVSYAYDAAGNRMSKRIAIDYAGPWDSGRKLGINDIVDAVLAREPLKGNKAGIQASVIDILEHILQGTPMPSGEKAGLTKTVLEVISGSVFGYTYSYNKADQLLSYTDPVTSCAYSLTYDSRGNLTAKEDHTGTALYAWDSRNRLVSLGQPPSSSPGVMLFPTTSPAFLKTAMPAL